MNAELSDLRKRQERFVEVCVESLGEDDEDFDINNYLPPALVNNIEFPTTEQQWRDDVYEGYDPRDNFGRHVYDPHCDRAAFEYNAMFERWGSPTRYPFHKELNNE